MTKYNQLGFERSEVVLQRNFQKTVLDDGLTILTEQKDNFYTVSMGFWVLGGGIDEDPKNMGISHFIEHMNFKGTAKRDYFEISNYLESLGGHLNAYTSKDMTCYYSRILREHAEKAVDLLADITFHSLYDEQEFVKEKQIILEEIRDVYDNPTELSGDLFYETVYHNHELGYPLLGTEKTIQPMTREDLIEYRRKRYGSENIIVSAAGNIEHQEFVDMVKKYYRKSDLIENHSRSKKNYQEYIPKSLCFEHNCAQVHSLIGLPVMAYNDQRKWSMIILNTMLGGGMSSFLFQEIREKMGIAYTIYSFLDFYKDSGLWGIYWSTEEEKFQPSLDKITSILKNELMNKITPKILLDTKNQLKGNLFMSLESVNNWMNRITKNEIYYQNQIDIETIIQKVEAITIDDIFQTCHEFIINKELSMTAVGKIKEDKISTIQL